ncbi:MAG: MaoC/PaaZ C-terminal domain-containing protein [SAR202 cluster bacterium]|jgi:3-hydroxybutyryl-CoA dehydratase|nr:MaoC/PaaZ C-terminal domain-containing protein [SAR202 cluster bacterium]|tara:strand:+ start:12404 stop:12796 length:393 start_codon:yes stop_codon:yes gene_type:complete
MNKFSSGYKLKSITNKIIQASVNNYAKASGDLNPIHLDELFAKKSIFKNTIAHGMMIGGILSEMLFAEYGDLWLSKSSIDIKFKAPVYMDEEITTYGKVVNTENNKLKIDLVVKKNNGTEAIKGFAIIEF